MPVFYSRPVAGGVRLGVDPALASWDRAGSAGQVRSAAFVTEVQTAVAGQLSVTPDPLALRLDVGLPNAVPLLALNDLDNYLFPLVPRLTAGTGRQFASVWATKRHAATSSVTVGQARVADDPGGTYSLRVRTTASAGTIAYKQQIRDQIKAAGPLPDGGVALELAFVVGPRRSWPTYGKPRSIRSVRSWGTMPGAANGTHATAGSPTSDCTASSTQPRAAKP